MCGERNEGRSIVVAFLSFKLESLPREELIKVVKKQAQLLQKTKDRCTGQSLSLPLSLPLSFSLSLSPSLHALHYTFYLPVNNISPFIQN